MCCILNQLDFLGLGYNPNIGDEGARSLIPCLEFIAVLYIDGCGISDAVEEEVMFEHKRRRLIVSVCIIVYTACMSGYQVTVV